MADDLDWLRERFQNSVSDETYLNGNIVAFKQAQPARDQSAVALELVDQAAEVFAGIKDHARQMETRTQLLVKSAVEKMQLLEAQLDSAAQDFKIAQSRLATAEAQLTHAEQRAAAAEAREHELQYALSRIEEAIRLRLLGSGARGKMAAAA
jgi:hypothetical protein